MPNGSAYSYEYYERDHLGNVRAVVTSNGSGGVSVSQWAESGATPVRPLGPGVIGAEQWNQYQPAQVQRSGECGRVGQRSVRLWCSLL